MPVGFAEAIAIWLMLFAAFLAAPLMAVAFYWRTPRPKTLAVIVSTVLLYPAVLVGLWAFAAVLEGSSSSVVLLFYLPFAASLLLAFLLLYPVRTLLRRIGWLSAA